MAWHSLRKYRQPVERDIIIITYFIMALIQMQSYKTVFVWFLRHLFILRPLVDASVSRTNITAIARLDPSGRNGIFVHTPTEQGSHHGQDATSSATTNEGRNDLHFEFVVAVKALNTKHAKMEDFIEPFAAFGNASYALKEAPASGGDLEQADKHEISCKIILPSFVSISVSPSAIETSTKLQEIAKQSALDVYEALAMDLQTEGVRDLWSFLDKVRKVPAFGVMP